MAVKIGLAGTGHLGKIHLKCIQAVDAVELIGFYDQDEEVAKNVAELTGVTAYADYEALLSHVDAVDIVTPTSTHYELALQALQAGKHVFIEKPVTSTMEEAEELLRWQQKQGVVVQVGHVERFNPAMLALKDVDLDPRFIEVHRLANFNPRGTDVSVVLDLMIHDLDIILSLVQAPIRRVMANGVCLVSKTPDIGNARIEWENGCVANVTASRMSLKNMRKMRLFQPDAYIGIDFLERSAQIITLQDGAVADDQSGSNAFTLDTHHGQKTVNVRVPEIKPVNAIEMEIQQFAQSILTNKAPAVGLAEACAALSLAFRISMEIDQNLQAANL